MILISGAYRSVLKDYRSIRVGRQAVQQQPLSQQVTARVEHAYDSCSNKTNVSTKLRIDRETRGKRFKTLHQRNA
jgi:hypothetical protein